MKIMGRHTAYGLEVPRDEPDPDWRRRAACRDNPDLWFAEKLDRAAQARHICVYHCPVLRQCFAQTRAVKPIEGVQGGLLWVRDRAAAVGRPCTRQPLSAEHGTWCGVAA